MALTPGTRLGVYEIVASIGAGGMGQVFRARDTKLDRDVAIKILPEAFAHDADRLARFQREAKTLASLNHPNIAAIHGLEESGGVTALVMELVEGDDLSRRIARGAIPLNEALPIAKQIAEALEAAHEQGIIHRDLKPANIKVRADGTVKVLDFGLAKAMEPAVSVMSPSLSQSPTITTPAMTQAGIILGTASYMSPEQASGKRVDRRTDIWAFGCVLYEMLTGRRAFEAADVPETVASVLAREPDWSRMPQTISPTLDAYLRRCLAKDPKQRVHDIGDMRLAIEGAFETGSPVLAPTSVRAVPWRKAQVAAVAFLGGAVLASVVIWSLLNDTTVPRVARFVHEFPAGQALPAEIQSSVTVAPDGSAFVYSTSAGIYLRRKNELEPVLIRGTDGNSLFPVFSPDGQSIGYWSKDDRQIKRIAVSGGTPVVVANARTTRLFGISWAWNGTFLYGHANGISRVSQAGGTPELIVAARDGEVFHGPHLLPDGDSILFSVTTAAGNLRWDEGKVVVFSPATGSRTVVLERGSDARYVPTGHLIYAEGNALLAVPFDTNSLTSRGAAFPVAQGVERGASPADHGASANYGMGQDGTLVYLSGGSNNARRSLVWVDRGGKAEPVTMEPGLYHSVRISPDGTSAVVGDRDSARGLRIWDFEREVQTRLSVGPAGGDGPTWSPDGTRVAYDNNVGGISWILANDAAPPERLPETPHPEPDPYFFSPDGTALVFKDEGDVATGWDIAMMSLERKGEVRVLVNAPGDQRAAALSRNGRWMAYESNESGRFEIYIRPFPNVTGDRIQVSGRGGVHPLWSPDGRELFYVEPSDSPGLMSVRIDIQSTKVTLGSTNRLFDWPYFTANIRGYDVKQTPDGPRFLAITQATGASTNRPRVVVVENFFSELQRLAPKN